MVLAAGIVGFILGVNLGFLFAGLMRAAQDMLRMNENNGEQKGPLYGMLCSGPFCRA